MRVCELMTPDPYCIEGNAPAHHAAQLMKRHGVGALPVFDDSGLVGIITDRDLVLECVAAGHAPTCPVSEHMTADPVSIEAEAPAEEALRIMGQAQVRRLCVMHRDRLAGIVSLGDLAVHLEDTHNIARVLARISQPVRAQV